jgi:hypothetical protein
MVTITLLIMGLSIAVGGSVIAYFFGQGIQPYEIAGGDLIGWFAIMGGTAVVVLVLIRKYKTALVAAAISVTVCNWLLLAQRYRILNASNRCVHFVKS